MTYSSDKRVKPQLEVTEIKQTFVERKKKTCESHEKLTNTLEPNDEHIHVHTRY